MGCLDQPNIVQVMKIAITTKRRRKILICSFSSSCGNIRVFYDPRLSKKGALLSSAKPAKREMQAADYAVVGEIINPNALPLFRVSISRFCCVCEIYLLFR